MSFMDNTNEINERYIDLLKKTLTASIYEESGWQVKRESGKRHIKNVFLKYLKNKSYLVVKVRKFDVAARENGKDWPMFGYTMAGHRRLDNVQLCVSDVLKNNIPGDFIETGAWRGGTTIFMRALLKVYGVTDRKVWVADSFEGLPAPKDEEDGSDLSQVDYLKVSLDQVKSYFEKFDLLDDQVGFIKGWFCDSLPNAPVEELSILRLDGDLYSSTMDSLQNLYHKVNKGGYVIVDDYHSWPECQRAITEFLEQNSILPDIMEIDGSAVYWKVS